mmetsp:Transcript_100665/g.184880  ORF Transcript_100665/g.184880 Transcript_100665/m.184880 type:complete len:722 (-) Transcript_100665:122-2287(-)
MGSRELRSSSPSPPPIERGPEPVKAVHTTHQHPASVSHQRHDDVRRASLISTESMRRPAPVYSAASAHYGSEAVFRRSSRQEAMSMGTGTGRISTISKMSGPARWRSSSDPASVHPLLARTNAQLLDFMEDDHLKRWPIWRWDHHEKYLAYGQLQTRGTITRRFMKLAANPRGSHWHSKRADDLRHNWEERISCMMTHPRHPKMSFWHLLGTTLIMYDVFMIPIDSFRLPETMFSIGMTWCSTCYWSSDFILQFFLGYENELGQVEVRPSAVAWNYLRTWFWMDAAIVTFDWLSLFVFNVGGASRSSRITRALKALRFVRTLRVVKLLSLVGRILDRVMTEYVRILAKVLLLLVLVFTVAHYLGCYWYFIGVQNWSDAPITWLTEVEKDEGFNFWRLYTISLHWSIAQSGFTPTAIYPITTSERLYVLFAGAVWLVISAATISKLTLWLIQLKDARHDRVVQETKIRKYLKDNGVSTDLCEEVVRACRKLSLSRARRVHTTDIVAFADLPLELRVSVHRQVFMPILTSHPLFEEFLRVNEAACAATCHLAMGEHYYRAGSEVFTHGEEAAFTFFVLSGDLEYFAAKNDYEPTEVKVGEWICEPVLWRYWVCQGRLIAKSSCELVYLDASKFHAIIDEGEDKGWSVDLLRNYAEAATTHFDEVDPNSDLWGQGENGQVVLPELVNQSWSRTYDSDRNTIMQGISSNSLGNMKRHLKQRLFDK